jgi:diguanylate cyclase (GGDEF)-like protein
MDFFASDDDVSDIGVRLALAADAASATLLVELAWQLRQRDTRRAVTLAEQAERMSACLDGTDPECRRLMARIRLIRAEADWLDGRLDLAMHRASQAVADFLELQDGVAAGDGQWAMACIWHEQGAFDRRDACLSAAALAYGGGSDARRGELVALRIAYHALHRSAPDSRDVLPKPVPDHDPPMILAWKYAIRALASNLDGNYGDAVKQSMDAHEAACRSGQIRQAIVFAMGVGNAFEYLNDLDAASEWIETGLKLAETAQWPALIGLGWYYVGAIMIKLNRPADAMSFLRDAVRITTPFGESANYNAACVLLASELMKSPGNEQEALMLFQQGQSIAMRLGTVEALFVAGRDLARLYLRLGRFEEAAREIDAALRIARDFGNGDWLLSALRVQADLQRHRIEHDSDAEPTVLACLDQALQTARTLKDFIVPPDLLEEVAAEHARCGDVATAYALVLEAGQSRERIHGQQASARAVAMQVRHETVQLRAETQHHRQLNEAQAQRADELQHSLSTLEELGAIGREITSNLDADDLFAALHRHAHRLLDSTVFEMFRFDAGQAELQMAFGIDAGRPIPLRRIALSDAGSVAARCARERQDVVVAGAPDAESGLGGSIDTASLLYGPLLNGDQLLGVMGVRSPTLRAYGERERAIFRNLCAYGAIALANALAMASLKRIEEKLVRQNAELAQMAITDRLTGLCNRLYLDRKLQTEFAAAKRYGTVFSLIILDMDHFKFVNDTYGHVAGDAVLVAIAELLKGHHRDADMVGRWGGEEFLVICPQTPVEGALIAAEHLRRSVAQHDFPHVGRRTASFGVAAYRAGDSILSLTARADRGLYLAKDSGRNRVIAGDQCTLP